jgi:hypothetical protein
MGFSLSRRCYRCIAVVGWNANLCSYCQFRSSNEESRGPAMRDAEPKPSNAGPTEDELRRH